MAYNHEYPYVDPNRYNADWILHEIMSVRHEMSEFEALNTITFSGEWDITAQYPAWTIVNTNNGTEAYISVQPVPAGITLDNYDYWRFVANYTNVLANLQNRVVALENTVGDADSGLVHDVNYLMTRNVNKFHNVIALADSWGGTGGWCEKLRDMGFSDGTFQQIAVGGRGFQTNTPTFHESIVDLTPLVDPDLVDCIIIIGGTNDQTNLAQLPVSIGSTVAAAKTRFKNATVYVGFNIHYIVGFGQLDATEIEGSRAVVQNGGVPLTGLSFNQRFCRLDWQNDNWHLSDYTYFAEMIYSGIYCGTIDVPRTILEQDLGISNTVIRSVKANYKNGYGYLTIALNSGQTFATLGRVIDPGTIPLLNLYGRTNQTIKSSTAGDTLDLFVELGMVDTFIGGSIGGYPITFNVVSHHGCMT